MSVWAYIASTVGYAALEYWLGRTKRVRAGSLVEVLLVAAKIILRRK